tara:strand:- start:192 stop:491 length:300 start_codon:yes stop_codon:yes gene_type:complete
MGKAMNDWSARMERRAAKEAEVEADAEERSTLNLLAAVVAIKATGRLGDEDQAGYAAGMRQLAGIDLFRADMWRALATECAEATPKQWTDLIAGATSAL